MSDSPYSASRSANPSCGFISEQPEQSPSQETWIGHDTSDCKHQFTPTKQPLRTGAKSSTAHAALAKQTGVVIARKKERWWYGGGTPVIIELAKEGWFRGERGKLVVRRQYLAREKERTVVVVRR